MKQSSIEPPKKKLKQARLPFQILSPPVVKNCEVSLPSQCKRKATETASDDDDVVVSEINENQIKPAEKKAKVVSKDKVNDKREGKDACIEIEEVEEGKKVPPTKQHNTKSINAVKKVSRTTSNRKSNRKNLKKVPGNKNEKTEIQDSISKSEVVDMVDLCDSPAKTSEKDEESIPKEIPKYKGDSSLSDSNGKRFNDDLHGQSSPSMSCSIPEKDASNSEILNSKEKDSCKLKEALTGPSNVSSDNEIIEDKNSDVECLEKYESTQETSIPGKIKDLAHKSSTSDKDSSGKNSLKQSSIKNIVRPASKSPKSDSPGSANQNSNNDKSNVNTSDSNKCLTPSRDTSPSKNSTESVLDESSFKTPSTANDSLQDDSSPSSECNTSSLSTPGTDSTKRISKTPRRMTPKQLLKLKEKEEKRKEKERLKEEKDKKKAEEKEEKLKLKKEKEEERLRLKQEKEDEKRKEKEEKEKKKQAELDQKNEEKRLKEEEKRQKEDEKRAKDEEKRKKEEDEKKKKEEKRLREEQKEAEKRKSAQAFASFFVKTETKPGGVEEDKESTPVESNFQPFEVKNDMRLAPLLRTQLPEERRQLLDSVVECSTESTAGQRLYLQQLRSPSYTCGSAPRTWPPPDGTDDEVIIIESEKPNEEMELDENETEKKPEKRHRRAKLLQFHENRRPPYWGTWRKKSKHIRPRAPLSQDKSMLEYEVDSDDEWEEPGEGESLRGSEDEESQDEQYEEDNDMFVPHGYLSDGEGEDELDDQSPEIMKAKLKLLQIEFETERNEKQEKLKPRLIGCVWFCNSETNPPSVGGKISELFLSRKAVWEGSLPVTVAVPLPSSPSTTGTSGGPDTPGTEPKIGAKKRIVKESMVPDIIKKVHGSRRKLSKLLQELRDEWDRDKAEPRPSRNALVMKIRELAAWERPAGVAHHCWYVKEDVRRAYGLTDLDIPSLPPPTPSCATPTNNITKFTKVLTTDERLKLLRESPAASKEVPKDPSKTTPSFQSMKTPNTGVKTPTVKLGTPSPAVKKRVPLISVGPKESPKQNTTSIMNFVTKSTKSEESECAQKQGSVKVEEKVKKRITPITLTTAVSKPTPQSPSPEGDCIILDD